MFVHLVKKKKKILMLAESGGRERQIKGKQVMSMQIWASSAPQDFIVLCCSDSTLS